MAKKLSEEISSNRSIDANVSSSSVQSIQSLLLENLSSVQAAHGNFPENESSVSAQAVQLNLPGNINSRHRYLANRQARIQIQSRRISALSHYKPSKMRSKALGGISEENIKWDKASPFSEKHIESNKTFKLSEKTIKFDKGSKLSEKLISELDRVSKPPEKSINFDKTSKHTETTIKYDRESKKSEKTIRFDTISGISNKKYIDSKSGQVMALMSKGYVYFTPEKGQHSKIKSPTKVVSCYSTENYILSPPSISDNTATSHQSFPSREFHNISLKSVPNDIKSSFFRPVNSVAPVQRAPSPEIYEASKKKCTVGSRYTIQEEFLEIWRSKLLDQEILSFVQKQWLSDCWDGLYDPPKWLKPEMFAIALTGIESNKLMRRRYEKAKANLEMARLTHSCRVKHKCESLRDEIILQYSNHFNVVGVNLIKLLTRVTYTIDRLKTEIEETGNSLIENANKLNVEIKADLSRS